MPRRKLSNTSTGKATQANNNNDSNAPPTPSSKLEYQQLLDTLPVCIARFDHKCNLLFANAESEKIFAFDNESTSAKHAESKNQKIKNQLKRSIKNVFKTGKPETIETCFDIGNDTRHYEIKHIPELDDQNIVRTVLGIAQDITVRKEEENAHRQHLEFMQNLDFINRILQEEGDIELIMTKVLDEMLSMFDCDRAYILFPCDPDADEWQVPIERTNKKFPGAGILREALPMNKPVANKMHMMLSTHHAMQMTSNTKPVLDPFFTDHFNIQSIMCKALHPKTGKPWEFGIQRCEQEKLWSDSQQSLFEEIGHRLSDGLNNLLITRNLRESEERFRLVYEDSPVPIWEEDFSLVKTRLDQLQVKHGNNLESYLIANPDIVNTLAADVRIINVNKAVLKLHHADSKEQLLKGIHHTFTAASYDAFRDELIAIAEGQTKLEFDSIVQTFNGDQVEVNLTLQVCPGYEKTLSRVLVSTVDITERKRNEENIRLAATVFSASQEAIYISDANNHIIDINDSFTRLTNYSLEEAIGRNPRFLSAKKQNKAFHEELWQSIQTDGRWYGEIWNRRKSGEIFPALLSIVAVKNDSGQLLHYVAAFSDISTIKQHEADLNRMANYDLLTDLPNRRMLHNRLEDAIENARKTNQSLAVCYLDIDNFKSINDKYEHEGGDLLLIEFSKRLKSILRPNDTVARLGGDEFVLLWNDIKNKNNCTTLLGQTLSKITEPMFIGSEVISVSASIGITFFPDDHVDSDNLLRHADHAMYNAKQHGKNCYQFFDVEFEQAINSRSKLISKIALALHKNQLQLYYQPKINYMTKEVIGAEALLRWHDPKVGVIEPKEFLSTIENHAIALDIGRWVLRESIQQAKHWHNKGIKLTISTNVFSKHLKSSSFVDDTRQAISELWPDMPKGSLLMEIVETAELENLEYIEEVIAQCLVMGIGFSLDDFGTGYSSLTYLQRLSIEELKIDQSFVRNMLDDPNDKAIAISIIGLGKVFNLRVVAEGVETEKHAKRLLKLGCEIVQGYALGKPMPAPIFEEWVTGPALQNLIANE